MGPEMNDGRPQRFKLDELAERAGVSPRTVRYYVQRGLLPAPEFKGPDTAYDEGHLHRLRAIRVLQERHLPLDAIEATLASRSAEEIARIAKGRVPDGVDAPAVVSRSPAAVEAPPAVERVTRHRLAPGLELIVSDTATPEVRALADSLLRHCPPPKGSR
ncbi:MAG: Transcriptional regulator, MerR family [Myxococcaceae bacterium]|nr:Transcriptional regulator, MerR family [Myxococcaceae bacterium]